jgi:hypothetical protein
MRQDDEFDRQADQSTHFRLDATLRNLTCRKHCVGILAAWGSESVVTGIITSTERKNACASREISF